MDDLPPVGLRPAVHRGPRRGHAEQIVLALPANAPVDEGVMFRAYASDFGELPEVEEVIPESPRRGKRKSRELVFMTIRFVRGITADKAKKIGKRTVKNRYERFMRVTPAVRLERAAHKCNKRFDEKRRSGANRLERTLRPA